MTLQVQTDQSVARPRLLYVGDVPVRNDASGGSIVLWRHQQRLRDFVLEEQLGSTWSANSCSWISKGLRRCRLSRLELILRPWIQSLTHYIAPERVEQIRSHYVGILTVAHGTRWLEAMKLAEHTGLPLISIFHDWYPDASGCPKGWTWVWDQWFRRLYQRSALAFVVSPGMGRELGHHPNSHLLPPIPANSVNFRAKAGNTLTPADSSKVRLYYAGLSGGLYAPMLMELIKAVQEDERFQLRISGSETAPLVGFNQKGKVEILGFLNGDDWQRAFDEADLLLVVLPFEKRSERHLRTHFPSKLVEYANRGRPILIWGPETSSAVTWARDASNVLVCTSKHVEALLETAAELAVSSRSGCNVAMGTTTFCDKKIRFEPELIHKDFEYQLKRLVLGVSRHH